MGRTYMRVSDQDVDVADLLLPPAVATSENHVRSGLDSVELDANELENRLGLRPGHPANVKADELRERRRKNRSRGTDLS